jgi:hypothetical protein
VVCTLREDSGATSIDFVSGTPGHCATLRVLASVLADAFYAEHIQCFKHQ